MRSEGPCIERVEVVRLSLELKVPLHTARGPLTRREGFVVRVHDSAGGQGLGEAMPLPEFGTESREEAELALRSTAERWRTVRAPGSLEDVAPLLGGLEATPSARHALELALLDALGQRSAVPLARLLVDAPSSEVEVSGLLSERSPEALQREAAAWAKQGVETLKLKVGLSRELDAACCEAVRRGAGREVSLRVDANGAWANEAQARARLEDLARFDLACCEQPVPASSLDVLRSLRGNAPCVIAADESLVGRRPSDLLKPPAGDVWVLKPMVLGGLLPALEWAREAFRHDVGVYVTGSLDGVIARAGATHLAAALLGLAPTGRCLPAGVATGGLLVHEPENAFVPRRGIISLPSAPGLGWGEP
jgi:o-succinylbenzoate synthase